MGSWTVSVIQVPAVLGWGDLEWSDQQILGDQLPADLGGGEPAWQCLGPGTTNPYSEETDQVAIRSPPVGS